MSMIDPQTQALCCQIREKAGDLRALVKALRGKVDPVEMDEATLHLLEFTAGINRAEFLPVVPVTFPVQPRDGKRLAANDPFEEEVLNP